MIDWIGLRASAHAVAKVRQLNDYVACAHVGAAIQSDSGQVYTGVNLDTACSLGFCAEHSAVAELLKHGEAVIKAVVAVDHEQRIYPPCGRCRELMSQLHVANLEAEVMVAEDVVVTLADLLPFDWKLSALPSLDQA